MDKQQLGKLFDERFNVEILNKHTWEQYFFWAINNEPSPEDIKSFFFDTVIPEVIKSILPKNDTHIWISLEDWIIDDIKQKAKDLYWITL